MEPGLTDTHTPKKTGKKRGPIFYGWYMVVASIAANTIFSAASFQGFGVLIIPIERTFGWDRWVISAAMSLRQLESGIVSPAVGLLLDRVSSRKLIFWSAVISAFGFIGLGFTTGIVAFFLFIVVISLGASGVSHAVTWPVIISRWFRRKRGLAMGLAVTGPIFGSPILILHPQLEGEHGWRATGRSPTVWPRTETRRRRTPPRTTPPAYRPAGRTAGSRSMRYSAPGSSGCSPAT